MKKIIALALCLVSTVAILCSCIPNQILHSSSTAAGAESSVAGFEDLKPEINSNKTSSKNEAEYSSSKKEENKSSSNKFPNRDEDSSIISSKNNNTASVSTSSSVKVEISKSTMEIGCFQFTPHYCINYKDTYVAVNDGDENVPIEKKLEEFEDVLKEGYFNTVFLNKHDLANEKLWQIIEKYKVKVWLLTASYYKKSFATTHNMSFDDFMKDQYACLNFIKDNPKRWALFNGVAFDEIIHRGCEVDVFVDMTEYVYKKFGKRNFPVMAPQECTKLWWNGEQQQTTEGCKYFTDIAFDMYDGDVRDFAESSSISEYANNLYPEYNIQNDKDVYRMMTSEMLKLVGRPITVWYYPSAHKKSDMHTESYCLAQLIFFEELLTEQEHPGGIVLYTYAQSKENNYGLASFLDLGENANKTIRKQEDQVWHYYSHYLKDLTARYRNTPNNPTINLGI